MVILDLFNCLKGQMMEEKPLKLITIDYIMESLLHYNNPFSLKVEQNLLGNNESSLLVRSGLDIKQAGIWQCKFLETIRPLERSKYPNPCVCNVRSLTDVCYKRSQTPTCCSITRALPWYSQTLVACDEYFHRRKMFMIMHLEPPRAEQRNPFWKFHSHLPQFPPLNSLPSARIWERKTS